MSEPSEILEELFTRLENMGGCGDGGCVIHFRGGQHTNGGCRCYMDKMKMQRMGLYVKAARERFKKFKIAEGGT